MPDLTNLGEVFQTDVLILGGGLAGLIVASRIKETNSDIDVLVVEKSTAGSAGAKANKGAGVMWVMDETDDVDAFREYYCKVHGHYLCDQELLEKVCGSTLEMVRHLERWGIDIKREPDGRLARLQALPLWSLCAYDLDILNKLKAGAVRLGVKTLDKTQSVELLTDGNRVVGAVGFDLIEGTFRIFKSKAVVLATGSCNWMVSNMWFSGRGDGIAAAYRAGAEMRNAEFSNFYNLGVRGSMEALVGGQFALYNSDGEYLATKYCADSEVDIDIGILLGMEKEVMEGKGPIVFEESEFFANNPIGASGLLFRWKRPVADAFWHKLMEKQARYNSDHAWRPEVIPMFIGEFAAVKTDHDMRTTLQGAWALGDTNRTGSGWSGARPHPSGLRGSGLTWAGVSALLSEKSLTQYAKDAAEPKIDPEQVSAFKEQIYTPMKRDRGTSPRDAIRRLQEVLTPPRFGVRKSKERIEEALARVREVWQQAETEVTASKDWHMLGLCSDLRNMTQCADLYYTACLARTESRGWHYREDFPARDDENWLRWIDLKQNDGKTAISTDRIPIERYKTRPEITVTR